MPTPAKDLQPDLSAPLCDTELIPEPEFQKKLKGIFSVTKTELDEHIRNNPDPPQKRGRKPKEK